MDPNSLISPIPEWWWGVAVIMQVFVLPMEKNANNLYAIRYHLITLYKLPRNLRKKVTFLCHSDFCLKIDVKQKKIKKKQLFKTKVMKTCACLSV